MPKYRRIEVNAFRRRVTIVSGEWPRDLSGVPPTTENTVSLADSDSCEPVEPDSPEGQQLLIEAVSSLQRRLSPEARATMRESQDPPPSNPSSWIQPRLRWLYEFLRRKTRRLIRKEV